MNVHANFRDPRHAASSINDHFTYCKTLYKHQGLFIGLGGTAVKVSARHMRGLGSIPGRYSFDVGEHILEPKTVVDISRAGRAVEASLWGHYIQTTQAGLLKIYPAGVAHFLCN